MEQANDDPKTPPTPGDPEPTAPPAPPVAPAPAAVEKTPVIDRPVAVQDRRTAAKVVLRYGYLGFVGEFEYNGPTKLVPDQPVLAETDRGLELCRFMGYLTPQEAGLVLNRRDVDQYLKNSGQEYLRPNSGRVVRPAGPQDLREEGHIRADAKSKIRYCDDAAVRFGLRMKVVCVEHLFGGERIIFYFTSEGRVDFRELVRELARERP